MLSPIEPVAPSTLTTRAAEGLPFSLRSGTALIKFSPGQKAVADCIGTASDRPDQCRGNEGSNQAVEPVQ